MKLTVTKRSMENKGETNRVRREGNIPAILYSRGNAGDPILVKGTEFKAAIRGMQAGMLPTTVFSIVDEKGKARRALVKDIQYNVVNYDVLHLDFEELHDDCLVSVNVPIEYTGIADCAGIKLGGVLRQVLRNIRVRCLPKDIPTSFTVDVKDMALGNYKRVGDLGISDKVKPLNNAKDIAVVIRKR